jgi:DNA-binding GntR family transcriptional regulator
MTERTDAKVAGTLTSGAYDRLRREIVTGQLAPDLKLRIDEICQRYDVGATPVREALNRLSAEGLVIQTDQRGFRVAPVSREELEELTRTRIWVDSIGLRESIDHGDEAWEEAVLLAFHRLGRANPVDSAHGGLGAEWERRHRGFHTAMIGACRSSWLVAFSERLFDCFGRYRYLSTVMPTAPRKADREHRALMEAALARNADLALRLLAEHYRETAALVLAAPRFAIAA